MMKTRPLLPFLSILLFLAFLPVSCRKAPDDRWYDEKMMNIKRPAGMEAKAECKVEELAHYGWRSVGGMAATSRCLAVSDPLSSKIFFYDRDMKLLAQAEDFSTPIRLAAADEKIYAYDFATGSIGVYGDQHQLERTIRLKDDDANHAPTSMVVLDRVLYLTCRASEEKYAGVKEIHLDTGEEKTYGEGLFHAYLFSDGKDLYCLDYTRVLRNGYTVTFYPRDTRLRRYDRSKHTWSEGAYLGEGDWFAYNLYGSALFLDDALLAESNSYGELYLFDPSGKHFICTLAKLPGHGDLAPPPTNLCLWGTRLFFSGLNECGGEEEARVKNRMYSLDLSETLVALREKTATKEQ